MTLWFSELLGSVEATLKLWKGLSTESGAAENQETESASVCCGELWGEFVASERRTVFRKIVSFCQLRINSHSDWPRSRRAAIKNELIFYF